MNSSEDLLFYFHPGNPAAAGAQLTYSTLMNFILEAGNATLVLSTTNDTNPKNFSRTIIPDYVPYSDRPETYIVPVLFFIIFVVGVLGNGTLVLIFLRHRTMRNVPNTYILSLALADLLVILTSVPFTSIIYTLESWPWGAAICKISEAAKDISIGVSVFTLTALSGDRFLAIVNPLKKLHTTSGGQTAQRVNLGIAVGIWLLAIGFAIPTVLGSHLKYITDPEGNVVCVVCYPFPPDWLVGEYTYAKLMVMTRFLLLYILPLIVIAVFYIFMARHLIASTKNVPGEMQGTQRQIRARKKVAITVLIFVMVFAVCFFPYHLFMLFFYFHPRAESLFNAFWNYLRIIGFCLCYLNSCANPVALYWVSGAFRKHFNRYLLCIKPRRTRCSTCHGEGGHQQHATTMSQMTSTVAANRRNLSVCSSNHKSSGVPLLARNNTICHQQQQQQQQQNNRRLLGGGSGGDGGIPGSTNVIRQETSVTLLGNGNNEHACSRM